MSVWDDVRRQIETHNAADIAALVGGLAEQERRVVGKELPRYLREVRAADEFQLLDRRLAGPLRVAGAVCMGGAAATAEWLCRADLRWWPDEDDPRQGNAELITRAVADRPAEWRAEVARRITSRLRAANLWEDSGNWRLAAELVKDAGADPPADDVFVLGWVLLGSGSGPGSGVGEGPPIRFLTHWYRGSSTRTALDGHCNGKFHLIHVIRGSDTPGRIA